MGTYTYTSGFTFSYKFWYIEVKESFLHWRTYFYLSGFDIYLALLKANPQLEIGSPRAEKMREAFTNYAMHLVEDHACKFHTFGMFPKFQKDAMEYVDNVLGDGWTYMQKHNMIDLSKF